MEFKWRRRPMIAAAVICALLSGCASFAPKDNTAMAATRFEIDKGECWEQANRSNSSAGDDAIAGLAVGAIIGAGEGAVAGAHQGATGEGAWIGAAAGAGVGLFIGLGKAVVDFNTSYRQCMEGRQYVQAP
ncbi:conserved membrane hypothetical protein [Rhodospirillaceae bacterium LM-1]|nr:conserved membrane hypothetical protein [Rhodospirillaceae bacterium LM-1]